MSKATEELMAELHGMTAAHMMTRIQEGSISASELSVIVKFLKDNDIQCDPQASDDMLELASALPDPSELDLQH